MITTISINQNAANPNVALQTFYAFKGSYSNLRIKDIPPKIGSWNITDLSVQVSYPDNTSHIDHCVEVSGVYVSTLPPSDETGRSANGYQVLASGIDEDGSPVNGYVLGSGDVVILDVDATVTADDQTYYLHMRETRPEDPVKGDSYIDNNGMWHIYTPIGWADFMTSQVVINTYSREECDAKFRDKNDLNYGVAGTRYEILWNGTNYICERYGEGQYKSPESQVPGFKWINLWFDEAGAFLELMQADDEGFPMNIETLVGEGREDGDSFQISGYYNSVDAEYKVEPDQIALKSYVDSSVQNYTPLTTFNNTLGNLSAIIQGI